MRTVMAVATVGMDDYVHVHVYGHQVEDLIRDAEEALRGAEERNAAFASRQVWAFLAIGQGQRRGSGRRKQQASNSNRCSPLRRRRSSSSSRTAKGARGERRARRGGAQRRS